MRTYISIGLIFCYSLIFCQITTYTDRTQWRNDLGNSACFSEDFESFEADAEFKTAPLQLNGFTLHQDVGSRDLANYVDVAPFYNSGEANTNGTKNAACFVEKDEPVEILLTFDQPVNGFFADYSSTTGNEILMQVYNNGGVMVETYQFTMNNVSTGFISAGEPITSIRFKAINQDFGVGGEIFGIDNIEISCLPAPIPTMNQWSIIVLLLCLSIIGLIFIEQIGLKPSKQI